MAELAVMWGKHHFNQDKIFNARDPLGATPHMRFMYQGSRDATGEDSRRAVEEIMDLVPLDDDRTPVRYGGTYHPACSIVYSQLISRFRTFLFVSLIST